MKRLLCFCGVHKFAWVLNRGINIANMLPRQAVRECVRCGCSDVFLSGIPERCESIGTAMAIADNDEAKRLAFIRKVTEKAS
jgi:hypothetical protein